MNFSSFQPLVLLFQALLSCSFTSHLLSQQQDARTILISDPRMQCANPDFCVAPDGSLLIVWEAKVKGADRSGIYFQHCDAQGAPLGRTLEIDSNGRQPSVAVMQSRAVVVWSAQRNQLSRNIGNKYLADIRMRAIDLKSLACGPIVQVNTTTGEDHQTPVVTPRTAGDALIAWRLGDRIECQRLDANGSPIGSNFSTAQTWKVDWATDVDGTPSIGARSQAGYFVTAGDSCSVLMDNNQWENVTKTSPVVPDGAKKAESYFVETPDQRRLVFNSFTKTGSKSAGYFFGGKGIRVGDYIVRKGTPQGVPEITREIHVSYTSGSTGGTTSQNLPLASMSASGVMATLGDWGSCHAGTPGNEIVLYWQEARNLFTQLLNDAGRQAARQKKHEGIAAKRVRLLIGAGGVGYCVWEGASWSDERGSIRLNLLPNITNAP